MALRVVTVLVFALAWLASGVARAGGMNEAPEQGAQALARGGAFVAKADDATAILHNVAGLAGQRGTRILLGANLQASTFTFRRTGNYPEGSGPDAGRPYPAVTSTGGPGLLPMLAVASDLGTERLGVGLGVFGPNANTGKRFEAIVGSAPSPARYDTVSGEGSSLLLVPTVGAAYALSSRLRIGVSAHAAFGSFQQGSTLYWNLADAAGKPACAGPENPKCDGRATVSVDGLGFGAAVGALYRASEHVELGAQARTGSTIDASGQAVVMRPNKTYVGDKVHDATLALDLPFIAQIGARYVETEGTFEVYDLEVDVRYEGWGASAGPRVDIPGVSTFASEQGWNDTFALRAGGAYNLAVGRAVVALRAGAYYDGSATEPRRTRLDWDTLTKVGSTLGVGLKAGAFALSVAYAATASIPRTVTDGALRLENAAEQDVADRESLGVLNDGEYRGFSHTLGLSVEVDVARLLASDERATEPQPAGDTIEGAAWKTRHAPSRRARAASVSAR